MSASRALLEGIIDYAGLFPPAALTPEAAFREYDTLQQHPQSWMLARFVLPVSLLSSPSLPSRLSVVAKGEAIEFPPLPSQVESLEIAGSLKTETSVFVFQEIDWRTGIPGAMPDRGGVKLRTGGLTADMIPPASAVAAFLIAAAERRLPVKFTAGLHQPLPHEDASVGARMHGFLNIFAAAFAAYTGERNVQRLIHIIDELHASDFHFTETAWQAGPLEFPTPTIRDLRRNWVISFGSCSFQEPVDALQTLGFLA